MLSREEAVQQLRDKEKAASDSSREHLLYKAREEMCRLFGVEYYKAYKNVEYISHAAHTVLFKYDDFTFCFQYVIEGGVLTTKLFVRAKSRIRKWKWAEISTSSELLKLVEKGKV